MPYRVPRALAAPVLFAIAGFTRPSQLQAQAASVTRPINAATQLGALSRERAVRWAGARPVIHCSPAPLTERPGAAAEFARPQVTPLEEAFLDAAIVKRTYAAWVAPLNRPVR
jgi:hypothetical protein